MDFTHNDKSVCVNLIVLKGASYLILQRAGLWYWSQSDGSKFRESEKEAQKFHRDMFDLKGLKAIDIGEKYQIKISSSFLSLQSFFNSVETNRASENSGIKI